MLNALKKLFGIKAAEKTAEAPYKVETPAQTYEEHKSVKSVTSPVAEQATEAVVTSIEPAKKKPAKKAGAPKKQGANKPRKPRAPKQPKAN